MKILSAGSTDLMRVLWCLVYLVSRPQVDESSDIVSWLPSEMTSSHKSPPLLLLFSSSSLFDDDEEDAGWCAIPLSSTPTMSEPTRKLTCSGRHTDSVVIMVVILIGLSPLTWLGRRTLLLPGDPLDSAISGVSGELAAGLATLQIKTESVRWNRLTWLHVLLILARANTSVNWTLHRPYKQLSLPRAV